MSKVPALTSDNFASSVEDAQGVVVVNFTATWCPPCKMLAPVLDRVSEKYEGRAKFFKVDVDENPKRRANTASRPSPTSCSSKTAKW
jgi:thioredoxin 1